MPQSAWSFLPLVNACDSYPIHFNPIQSASVPSTPIPLDRVGPLGEGMLLRCDVSRMMSHCGEHHQPTHSPIRPFIHAPFLPSHSVRSLPRLAIIPRWSDNAPSTKWTLSCLAPSSAYCSHFVNTLTWHLYSSQLTPS